MSIILEGVILLAHGSKRQEANEEIQLLLKQIEARDPEGLYELALMSFGPPGIPEAVSRLSSRGARRIIVMPFFLVSGNHIHQDIPELLRQEQKRFPGLEFLMTRHLAGHPGLIDMVLDRVGDKTNMSRVE